MCQIYFRAVRFFSAHRILWVCLACENCIDLEVILLFFFFGLFGILMSLEYPAFWFWFCFGFAHFSPALPYDFLFSTYMYVLWTWASLWIPRFSFLCVYFQILATVHPNRAVCKNVCEWETGELAPGWDRGKPTAHSLSVGRQRHEEREARS